MASPTWSYSGDPSNSDVDTVRFYLQDTDSSLKLLYDEEIEWLIDEWMPKYDSLIYVASVAAATITNKFVGMVSISADGVSVSVSDLTDRYRRLAADLRDLYKASMVGGEVDIDNILIGHGPDPGIKPLRFGVGLHDNPEAGQQDFGGLTYDPFADALVSPPSW